ncbi:hypothetical protein FB45DRAFT_890666 [Roridomyces roridus]|uniref:Uncharacterized protein n=1 Tax=Roridomyces roridus TaxID=1738132 RepID=A0AAD7FVU8_9AGAR|nr:hypothetical protein FB45DRAFT_890666 [Roridomyces roridus]
MAALEASIVRRLAPLASDTHADQLSLIAKNPCRVILGSPLNLAIVSDLTRFSALPATSRGSYGGLENSPPSYQSTPPRDAEESYTNERTVLLLHRPTPPPSNGTGAKNRSCRLPSVVYLLLIAILFFIHFRPGDDALNPSVRNRIRREWEAELREHEVVRQRWEEERRELDEKWDELLRDRETWVHECEIGRREEERKRKEEEDRVRAAFAWDGIVAGRTCLRYGTRQYTARIVNIPREYDPLKACSETEVDIHGVKMASPHWCEDRGCNGVFGHWTVDSGEPSCATHFDYFKDKGCTTQGSGLRRIESHLEDLHSEVDWQEMCSTTPADFRQMHFDGPHICVNWGKYGTWGIWEIEDRGCY